jgi:hypothetical protein
MKPNAPWEGSSLGRSVAAVLAAAVIASAAVTGLLYAVGVAGGSTRTVAMSSGQTSAGSDPGGLDASSLYRSAAPGVVAIEATGDRRARPSRRERARSHNTPGPGSSARAAR